MDRAYLPRQYFSLDEKLDVSESRSVEFKAGPGFINNGFRDNVGKYVCGFINSNENGTLLLGVENSGLVKGYYLNSGEEDSIRRQIDEAVKDISPDVFPKDYSLRFIPVLNHYGEHRDSRFVIELSVFGSKIVVKDRLYESKQGVFLRRDGSIEGPLKAKKIQEWTRRMFETEMEKMRKNERNMGKELENRKSELDRRMKELELKEKDMEKREKEYSMLKDELQKRNSENDQQKARIKQLEESRNNQSQTSDEALKELNDIKQLLVAKHKEKSKVCVIV